MSMKQEKGQLHSLHESEALKTTNHTDKDMSCRKTPLQAIRENCYGCCGGGGWKAIKDCQINECSFHEYRFGKRPQHGAKTTPGKAIDEYCLFCMGARVVHGKPIGRSVAAKRARECDSTNCGLWHIRYGEKKLLKHRERGLQGLLEDRTPRDIAEGSDCSIASKTPATKQVMK